MSSALERKFALAWRAVDGPELVAEHRFAPPSLWRFDFAHPNTRIAVELEGGHWSGGRHTRGAGFEADCEKYNTAALLGWRVFRFTRGMITVPACEALADMINHRDTVFVAGVAELLREPIHQRTAAQVRAGGQVLQYTRGGGLRLFNSELVP